MSNSENMSQTQTPQSSSHRQANHNASATSSALHTPTSPSLTSQDDSLDIAPKRRFKSYRLRGDFEKPWLSDPAMKKTKWNNWIVRSFILLGFILAGVACFFMVWPYREGSVRSSLCHIKPTLTKYPVLPHLRRPLHNPQQGHLDS